MEDDEKQSKKAEKFSRKRKTRDERTRQRRGINLTAIQ
jgi:hypothetical protein